jgi:hypothetical protein
MLTETVEVIRDLLSGKLDPSRPPLHALWADR